ncbi:MAG: tetratricopeptide repeat protein [Lysobacter sp.]|nr:tetratricopeptide repeat protein [Lysobacter sp.]
MYRPTRRHVAAALILCTLLGLFGVWVLLHPASIWVQPWRATKSAIEENVMFGPYPVEEDFIALKARGVTTIISLLDSNIPYEKVLLAQEHERAARYGMRVQNYPMASILGQKFGRDYMKNSEAAARAALAADGTAYIHCYLGLHRAKNVQKFLDTFTTTATYVGVQSERPEDVGAEERALVAFRARDYQLSLDELANIPDKGIRATRHEAWTYYRLNRIDEARAGFTRALQQEPQDQESQVGLAYCALFENKLPEAGERFSQVLALHPDDVGATEGLAHVRFRQSDLAEAQALFLRAAEWNPDNQETRQMLDRLQSRLQAAPAAEAAD